jgi:hypothetical protein
MEGIMPYIETYIAQQQALSDILDYNVRGSEARSEVHHITAGCCFIGTKSNCNTYIQQQRAKQAIRKAERGMNPCFTR